MTREMNLVGAIRALEDSLFEIEKKFNDEVKPYKDGLEILKKLNTACTKCAGVGKILKSCNNPSLVSANGLSGRCAVVVEYRHHAIDSRSSQSAFDVVAVAFHKDVNKLILGPHRWNPRL